MRRALLLVLLLGLSVRSSRAHEGPPFLIITDHDLGPFTMSVWADPDIGTGTFFVVLEPPEGEELPDDISAEVTVAPTSGRLEKKTYTAEPQSVNYGARFMTEVSFDRGEMWKVWVSVMSPAGSGEAATEVEATPDGGIGPLGLIVYLLPFLAVGFLWFKAMMRKRQAKKNAA